MGKPKIRFKGFVQDWEQRKLGEISEFNPKAVLPDVFEYVDLESVVGTEMIAHKTTEKANAPSRAQRLAQTGDLFFQTVRPYQKNNYLFEKPDTDYVFSTGYAQMRPKIDGYFLLSSVQTEQFVKTVLDRCTGTSYPAINSNDLAEMTVNIPVKQEEAKEIGDYFRNLDNLITLHQNKCEQMKTLKKFMLQKMFPKNGNNIPEIRFEGYTIPWEQRKLDDIAKFSKGNGYSKGDLTESGTPIILYGRLYTKYETVISQVDTFVTPNEGSVYSKGGEIIVPASGESAEDIARASTVEKSGVLLGGDLNVMTPVEDVNSAFVALSISNGDSQRELAKKAQGKSVVHIHNEEIRNLVIPFPIRAEQDKIVGLIKSVENLITLHQKKCEQLKNIKKYMLQNMFV